MQRAGLAVGAMGHRRYGTLLTLDDGLHDAPDGSHGEVLSVRQRRAPLHALQRRRRGERDRARHGVQRLGGRNHSL